MEKKPRYHQSRRGGFAPWYDPHSDGQYEMAFFRSTDRLGCSPADRGNCMAGHEEEIQRAEEKACNGYQLRVICGSDRLLTRSGVHLHQLQRSPDHRRVSGE